jgi:cystathionine gamma-synthase
MHKSAAAQSYRTETVCVQAGTRLDTTFNAVAVPIYATSTFAFEAPGKTKGYDYSRTANPTRAALEECLAALEGGAGATATTTGMAAETSVMALFPAGSHIIAGHDIYGGTYRLFAQVLAERGLRFSFVDMRDPRRVQDALRPETRAIWIETPSNPLLNLVDIAAICAIARRYGQTTNREKRRKRRRKGFGGAGRRACMLCLQASPPFLRFSVSPCSSRPIRASSTTVRAFAA